MFQKFAFTSHFQIYSKLFPLGADGYKPNHPVLTMAACPIMPKYGCEIASFPSGATTKKPNHRISLLSKAYTVFLPK
ncbi:MAG: hypothetical protein V4585_08640 [Bacteroidota bacterium]